LKKFIKVYWLLFLISGVIILFDQVTKSLVRANIPLGTWIVPIKWLPFVKIMNWNNTGVAFGLFQGKGWIFAILAAIVSAAIIYYFPKISLKDPFIRWALALELGGAIGNLIDRIILGSANNGFLKGPVTDFISVGNFAVFNVADSCVTIGVFALVIGVIIQENREKRQKKASDDTIVNKDVKSEKMGS
jgi:signal peptidase II